MFRSWHVRKIGSWLALVAMLTMALPLQGGAFPLRAWLADSVSLGGGAVQADAANPLPMVPPCHLAGAASEAGPTVGAATPACEHFPDNEDGCHCVQWVAVAASGGLPFGLPLSAPPDGKVLLSLPPRRSVADFRPPIFSPA